MHAAPAVPLRRHHRDRRHAGGHARAHRAARTAATSEGVAAEALAAKWFEKSPRFTDAQNLDQLRQSLRARHRALLARAAATRRSASSPAPTPSRARAARRLGSIRWSPPTVRRCSTAPSSTRWQGARASPSPTMIAANVPGIETTDAHARYRASFDLAALPRGLEAGATIDAAPHGRPGRSADGGRPPGVGARQRRPAGDAGGGRLLLPRPLLQAEGRRRHRRPTSTG